MAAFVNPQGSVNGTSEADSFLFDAPLAGWVTMDALGGVDRLTVDHSAGAASSFQARDIFNSGVFSGVVRSGYSGPQLTYYNVEEVRFIGSAYEDFFEVKVGPASAGLSIEIEGGGGVDTLALDFQILQSNVVFQVAAGLITSNLGGFAGLERFILYAGSGNDVIQTGNEGDTVYAYGGSDDIRTGGGDDSVYSETGSDYVDLGAGYDTFNGNYGGDTQALVVEIGTTTSVSNGVTVLNAESITIGGGSGNDNFLVSRAGSVTLYGGSGFDTLTYSAALTSGASFSVIGYNGMIGGGIGEGRFQDMEQVQLTGGAFEDSFSVIGTYASAAVRLDGAGGLDRLMARFGDFAGATSFIVQADGTIVNNRGEFISFESFDLTGGSFADIFTTQSGNDSLTGGGGDDRLESGEGTDRLGGIDGNDQLFGGGGADELNGDSGDDVLDGGPGADKMWGGPGNDVYYVDAGDSVMETFQNGGTDEVRTGLATYVLGTDIENLTATSAIAHDFRGNSGNNVILGGAGNDFLRLQDGGDDNAVGGLGNDVFLFGAALTPADLIDGGTGTDQVAIQGDYSGARALTLGSNLVGIENLAILAGNDTRFGDSGTSFYDYGITVLDSAVASGVQLVVDASPLRAGEDLTFDGSAESDGSFFIFGGNGIDLLTGGSKNDVFIFGSQGQWGSSDVIVGGAGIDQLALRGNYALTFGAGQLIGIESIGVVSAHDTRYGALGSSYSYDFTMVDGNVASGTQMTVDAGLLRGGEHFRFDGSAELDGSFRAFGGVNGDLLVGSRNNDIIQGNGGADSLVGGAGSDMFRYALASDSTAIYSDHILDFAAGTDRIDLSRIDSNSAAAGDQAFTWVGSNAFSGTAGELRAHQHGSSWFVQGDTDGDGAADLVIQLTVTGGPLTQADFLP